MAIHRLSPKEVENAKKDKKGRNDYLLSDGAGLYLRVRGEQNGRTWEGRKVWLYHYKRGSKSIWMTLGEHNALINDNDAELYGIPEGTKLSLDDARRMAEFWKSVRKSKTDPQDYLAHWHSERERKAQQSHAERLAQKTVRDVAETFYARIIVPAYKRPEYVREILDDEILPGIGNLAIKDVTRLHVSELVLAPIVDRGARRRANQVLAVLKKLFARAKEWGHIERNIAGEISRESAGGKEVPRKRKLSEDELRRVVRKLYSSDFRAFPQIKAALKLLILTGQRVGETTRMRWEHVNLDKGEWLIPAEETKTGERHLVHLSEQAIAVLEELKGGKSEGFVLQSRTDPTKHTARGAVNHGLDRLQADLPGMEAFVVHDLRRTFVTHLNELGVATHVVEKMVNHKLDGVMEVYNRSEHLEARRQAFQLWGTHVAAMLADNVIPLKRTGS